MSRIIPTVGRIVYYYTAEVPVMGGMAPREGPFAAIITRVHSDICIDLNVFYPGGKMVDLCNPTSIVLQQEGDRPIFNTEPYAAWMPYQIGQATKTEAVEAAHDQLARDLKKYVMTPEQAAKEPKPMYAALDRCDDGCSTSIEPPSAAAPRVTIADIEANIASEHYFTADQPFCNGPNYIHDMPQSLTMLTFCVLVLKNGFTVTGESACASPENFDADIGRKVARQNAVANIWALEGYALKDRLAA